MKSYKIDGSLPGVEIEQICDILRRYDAKVGKASRLKSAEPETEQTKAMFLIEFQSSLSEIDLEPLALEIANTVDIWKGHWAWVWFEKRNCKAKTPEPVPIIQRYTSQKRTDDGTFKTTHMSELWNGHRFSGPAYTAMAPTGEIIRQEWWLYKIRLAEFTKITKRHCLSLVKQDKRAIRALLALVKHGYVKLSKQVIENIIAMQRIVGED